VDAVANRLSVHIENLRLTAQTEQALAETAEQARRRAVLNNTSEQLNRAETLDDIFNIIAENTAKILPSDRVTLAVLSEDGDQFSVMSLAGKEGNVPVRVNQPLAGSFIEKAIETGDILVMHDDEPNPGTGIQSSMIVPLVTGSGTMGTLNVGSKAADVYDDLDQGLILQIASILSSVIENKRLLTETQQRAKELTLINRIVSQMHAAQDVNTGLQFLAEELGIVLQAPLINVRLIDGTGTMLKVVAAHHPAEIPSPVGTVLPVGKNPAGNMLLAQQMVVIEDVANSNLPPQVQKRLLETGIRSIYIIPMMVGRDLIGSVAINLMEGGSLLTPDQLKLAETTVQQAATAVQNARLFAQEQERAAELSLINAVSELASSQIDLPNLFSSVSELLMETFAAESLYFALFDEMAQLISFPYFFTKADGLLDVSPRLVEDGGFTGQIIIDRKSMLRVAESEAPIEEMAAEGAHIIGGGSDSDCYLGTPLIVGNEVIGVLALNGIQAVRTYDEQDQRLLETLADTIGVAIQNIRQFQAAQRRAEREALINSISQKIQAAPTVQSALQTAVSELGQMLKLKKAAVVLTPGEKGNGHTQD
jgi:GAF domain-containing protein